MLEALLFGFWVRAWGWVLAVVASCVFAVVRWVPVGLLLRLFAGADGGTALLGLRLGVVRCVSAAGFSVRRGVLGYGVVSFWLVEGGVVLVNAADGVVYVPFVSGVSAVVRGFPGFLLGAVLGFVGAVLVLDGERVVRGVVSVAFWGGLLGVLVGWAVFYAAPGVGADGEMVALLALFGVAGLWLLMGLCVCDGVVVGWGPTSFVAGVYGGECLGLPRLAEFGLLLWLMGLLVWWEGWVVVVEGFRPVFGVVVARVSWPWGVGACGSLPELGLRRWLVGGPGSLAGGAGVPVARGFRRFRQLAADVRVGSCLGAGVRGAGVVLCMAWGFGGVPVLGGGACGLGGGGVCPLRALRFAFGAGGWALACVFAAGRPGYFGRVGPGRGVVVLCLGGGGSAC